jgi:hypothetical protein
MNDEWCDMAVSFVGHQSGNGRVVGRFALTTAHAAWAKRMGRWRYGVAGIKPGDIVFYDFGGTHKIANIDHVGILEGRRKGHFVTLEGNVGNQYKRMIRSSGIIAGYFRPKYDDAAPLPPAGAHDAGAELLKKGDHGSEVKRLQQDLNRLGAHPALGVDGDFGLKTDAAVKAFQRRWHLEVDGQAGPMTLGVIRRELKGARPPAK